MKIRFTIGESDHVDEPRAVAVANTEGGDEVRLIVPKVPSETICTCGQSDDGHHPDCPFASKP